MSNITVLGTGTWGIALARLLVMGGHSVKAWSKIDKELEYLKKNNEHPNLKGVALPQSIQYEGDIQKALNGSDIVVMSVPSPFVRAVAKEAAPYINGQIVVDVAKGFEIQTNSTLSEVIKDEIPSARVVVLSGPTHAEEVGRDLPTTIVSASKDHDAALSVQQVFSSPVFRVYINDDVLGVEICGALKNIIALATGVATGLGFGDNARAAIITRGIAEMARLGKKMGCSRSTFAGLSGVGDLIVTCTSMHSRNNKAGILIGKGYSVKDAIAEVGMVVEGINALPAAIQLAKKHNIEMPIIFTLGKVVDGKLSPQQAMTVLMSRELTNE